MQFALLTVRPDLSESGVDLTRYVFVCMLTIGLVLVCAWLMRRFVAQGLRRRAAMRSLAVVDVLPLGRRQRAVVLRCYDRSFLVGLGEREVTFLAELDPELQDELEPSPSHPPETSLAEASVEPPLRPRPRPTRESSEQAKIPVADNFAERLAAEVPLQDLKDSQRIQPGTRMPKEGLLG